MPLPAGGGAERLRERGAAGAGRVHGATAHASTTSTGFSPTQHGRDLLTGEDRSDLVRKRAAGGSAFRFPRDDVIAGGAAAGRRQVLVLPAVVHAAGSGYWFLTAGASVRDRRRRCCCATGWRMHLTSPVRALQKAVERFGQGDLSARVGSHARDELGQLARTFDRMADRIQTLLAAERRLLLDISHELRSPLARLGVAVELARSGDDPKPRSTAFRRRPTG